MLIGHATIYGELKKSFEQGRMHHAQLFLGPKFVGKSTLALDLILELQGVKGDALQENLLKNGLDPDTLLLWDDGEVFPIEQVRKLVERANQSHSRPFLAVLLENVGRLRVEAQNALLKTVEEAGEDVRFFLTAHEEAAVLPTLRSRCQVSHFSRVSDAEMELAFADVLQREFILDRAAGRPGLALRLSQDEALFVTLQDAALQFSSFLKQPNLPRAMELARDWEGEESLDLLLDTALNLTQRWVRENSALQGSQVLEQFFLCLQDLRSNVNKRLSLEHLFLSFVPHS